MLRRAQQLAGGDFRLSSTQVPALLKDQQRYDLAASFQKVAVETLVQKTLIAYQEFLPKNVVIAGGVAANQELRDQLAGALPISINYAPPSMCTDNGAMVAALGCFQALNKVGLADPYSLEVEPNLKM